MEAVGGRPGDGDEIEALLRHFFTSTLEPVAGVVTGKLHEVALLRDPQFPKIPRGLYPSSGRVRRVGTVTIDGDEASADFSAVFAPTEASAADVDPRDVTRYEGPMKLVRRDDGWKLTDFFVDGALATPGIHRLRGEVTSSGITVRPRLATQRRRGSMVDLTVHNDRAQPVWFAEAYAFRFPLRCHRGQPWVWMTVAPGETEAVTLGWQRPWRPFGSRIRLMIPIFDLGERRWNRIWVSAAREDGEAA
ncbi:MAG TPA: hypothetical protein VG318_03565 [Actinomycetota bacterium]|nr:hypothetical protein [Actinomycetota bacterium]